MLNLLSFLFLLQKLSIGNGQTWSQWETCSQQEDCYNKIDLICNNGAGLQCTTTNELYRVTLVKDCNDTCHVFNNSFWETSSIYQRCQGNCSASTKILASTCVHDSTCYRRQFFRCYNERTCVGVWRNTGNQTQCSRSCGGGTRFLNVYCENQTAIQMSSNCNGTFYGSNNQLNVTQPCNTHACPTWSSWSEHTSCSVSCGNGTQSSTSTCIYNGTVSSLCAGSNSQNKTRMQNCNLRICQTIESDRSCQELCWNWKEWKIVTKCRCFSSLNEIDFSFVALGAGGLLLIIFSVFFLVCLMKCKKSKSGKTEIKRIGNSENVKSSENDYVTHVVENNSSEIQKKNSIIDGEAKDTDSKPTLNQDQPNASELNIDVQSSTVEYVTMKSIPQESGTPTMEPLASNEESNECFDENYFTDDSWETDAEELDENEPSISVGNLTQRRKSRKSTRKRSTKNRRNRSESTLKPLPESRNETSLKPPTENMDFNFDLGSSFDIDNLNYTNPCEDIHDSFTLQVPPPPPPPPEDDFN